MAFIGCITATGMILGVMARDKLDNVECLEDKPLMKKDQGGWQDVPTFGLGSFDQVVGFVLGWQAQFLFALSIAIGQFATGVVYVDVITETIDLGMRICSLLIVGFVLSILSLIPTLRGVAVLSGLGLVIYIFFFVVLICKLAHGAEASAMMINHESPNIGKWFGMCSFAFGAFPISFVIYDDMRDRASFCKVITWTASVCWAIYASFGIIGYMCYGSDTEDLIFQNFSEGPIRQASYISLAAILILSYVIQTMPLFNWASKSCSGWNKLEHFATSFPVAFMALARWPIIWLAVLVAFLVPNIVAVISTVGAMCVLLSGFVFPAIVYFQLSSWHEWKMRCMCFVVAVVGLAGGIASIVS